MKKDKVIVIFSSHHSEEDNNKFIEHINKTIGVSRETYCYPNFNQYSLSKVYNQAIKNHAQDNAIMVFCHNDIIFETKNWGKLLLKHFNDPTSDYQIIGVAGSKEIPEHGCWYLKADNSGLNMASMQGKVNHDNGIRKWTSEYSGEIKGVEPVVTVDGLFIAVDTSEIEHAFDDNYGMWHYYDISFCIPNYLDGCNIGVVTDIRITHKSIGQTDQEWENNRIKFVEEYKHELPIYYSEPLEEDKLKILISCQFFNGYTGSEMSVYEMARGLVNEGHEVHVISENVGNPLLKKAESNGIKVWFMSNPPVKLINHFDIIHINHKPIGEKVLKIFNKTPAVMHVRSEVIPVFEEPIIHPNVVKYISIRDTVRDHIKSFGVKDEQIVDIDNPFDTKRFNNNYKKPNNEKKIVLFIGTLDHLRKEMLFDIVEQTKKNNQLLWIVGKNSSGYADQLVKEEHCFYFGVHDKVEDYIKKSDISVGIFRGRTTIEGWLCGNPAWIYQVDKQGNILSKEYVEVPEDVDKYGINSYLNKVNNLYNEVLNQHG